ncbi:hypothetical protein AB205_0079450 [Aquarana catesbeiana]|uniref:Uncharacterized protein n=1 Tax=Aquarana catesbeiana TaxID=8400 RepID=A0A2G9RYD4_AQUCT|nr:hypothetical protein AB205_0079450 [Aquarana catesbeiana]
MLSVYHVGPFNYSLNNMIFWIHFPPKRMLRKYSDRLSFTIISLSTGTVSLFDYISATTGRNILPTWSLQSFYRSCNWNMLDKPLPRRTRVRLA